MFLFINLDQWQCISNWKKRCASVIDTPYVTSYLWSFGTKPLSLTVQRHSMANWH